ncbi:MAG: pilus (MSHA type) biogenesis protein MshL, partial [Proteobacteria bacterium]|nr:pilus (MSHA type) biogenesis protein MshL [Pseudomonadota bacterium]
VPIIAAPEPAEKLQTFTIVVTDIPASELLFALARDARLNLDIHPAITGRVSINAIDQTLPQILRRISRQVSLRYYTDGPNLIVEPDRPFTRIYKIDYLNISRTTSSNVQVSTKIASTGTVAEGTSGGSDSSTTVTNESENNFWGTLEENIQMLATTEEFTGIVISNRESGVISVRTTSAAHEDIQRFVDRVIKSARKQVLIEATVVEVRLNDDFQAGVDWSRIATGDGWSLTQSLLGTTTLGTSPFVSATYIDTNADRTVTAAIKALDSFGNVSVMSSPKIMALNNQTSILKVVDNIVYFSVDTTENISEGGSVNTTFDVTVHTVPVGFVMNVTPFITENDEVILNIRPTISRIERFVPTPVQLSDTGEPLTTPNLIPEIRVREMETVLRVADGHTAVIGGLMQDTASQLSEGLPGLHDARGIGLLFGVKTEELAKTELVIFLRPRIIDNASLDTNLSDFKRFLKPKIFSQ